MPKSELRKTKRPRKTVDLAGRYREIGINAVAAAMPCQDEKKRVDRSASRQQKEKSPQMSGRVKW